MARFLISLGLVAVILGVLWHFGYRLGSLPGDINIDRGQTRIMLPLASCLAISLLFSLIHAVLRRF